METAILRHERGFEIYVPGGPAAAAVAAGGDVPERTFVLPDGREVFCQTRTEAEHIYEDIFEKNIYLRHGVTLREDACVFDVGGNIGMFTLFVHERCSSPRIFTFEPAPPIFRILRANVERFGAPATLYNCGVSDHPDVARLTFYPYSSGMSSFHADLEEERAVLRSILDNQRHEQMPEMAAIQGSEEELLDARFTSRDYDCPLVPLSQIIAEQRVEAIDLLKIDVQKCELEVLLGLHDGDWRKVRQIVMEVHDLDGRLRTVVELLESRGFYVVVEQDPLLTGSVLYNLFAISKANYAGSGPGASGGELRVRGSLQKSALARLRRPVPERRAR